jgi:hypothetical protein
MNAYTAGQSTATYLCVANPEDSGMQMVLFELLPGALHRTEGSYEECFVWPPLAVVKPGEWFCVPFPEIGWVELPG